ncbi:MAG TPA: BMP family ABC transporter substrate-binding protein [Candidatus Atribacteria bacterium]|nr:BMP family ABC transporter substrate-binding protein [Candidatus Atribacteria bacterium]
MKRFFSLLVITLFLVVILSGVSFGGKLKIGFIYVGPVGDAGWTYAHDLGRKYLEKSVKGVETVYLESVPEGSESITAMENFIATGCKVIFATSYGYMDPVQELAKRYPNVIFEHCSGYKRAKNVGTYFGRMYEPRFLTGIVAGLMTKSNKIGYVAAHPIPEVIRGINAFALGVRKVNPEAIVTVVWTNTWYDPATEKEAALSLLEAGCDVIAQHQDSPAPQQAAEEKGVYSIGYNSDMSKFAKKAHLTAPIWNWGVIYEYIVKEVLNKTWKSEDIWWGMDKEAVDIAPFGPMVPDEVKAKVSEYKEKIENGSFFVFSGPIKDQKGNLIVKEGERLSDSDMLRMNFFVEGVKGTIQSK